MPSSDGDNPLSLLGGHLKAVQIEAVLNSIWTKVKQLGEDSNNFRSEVGSADRRLALLESQMTNTITTVQRKKWLGKHQKVQLGVRLDCERSNTEIIHMYYEGTKIPNNDEQKLILHVYTNSRFLK